MLPRTKSIAWQYFVTMKLMTLLSTKNEKFSNPSNMMAHTKKFHLLLLRILMMNMMNVKKSTKTFFRFFNKYSFKFHLYSLRKSS